LITIYVKYHLLFSLDYPASELQDIHEIDKILPPINENDKTSSLVEKARALWKKWIVLKIIYKIPKKIDQHKPNIEMNSIQLSEIPFPPSIDITLEQKT